MSSDIDALDQRIILSIIEDLGYKDLLNHCEESFDCTSFEDKAAMVIGYKRINQRYTNAIYIGESVQDYIDNILKPYTDMGLEMPFFLLGNYNYDTNEMSVLIDKVIGFNNNLKSGEAIFKSEDVSKIENEIKNGQYNAIIMGHTHPKIISDVSLLSLKDKILWEYIRSIKSELDLRGNNLDITIMDIASYVTFYNNIKYIKKDAVIMNCIYHNNGELNFICYDGRYGLALATNVYRKQDNDSLIEIENFDSEEIKKVR